ncbi:cryptochrome/photolyase family protein [Prochlorococcus sp. MIT 1223]|uniref:cryptochrome/photolyase family protein n=1 Tax=Prochlorococcus sp. MIT 1223 TaxID=3096217 RepID=UPI002A762938|nr:FAD-binding domain-containing protein [Prochlorococcus sp. MIT 1223]
MSFECDLFWHRKDLRIRDNIGLLKAAEKTKSITGVYVFDQKIFNPSTMSTSRAWFILESLKELQQSWRKAGSELLLLKGDPIKVLPILCKAVNAKAITCNKDIDFYSRERDRELKEVINRNGVIFYEYWDHLLIEPGVIKTNTHTNFKVYTPFSSKWKKELINKKNEVNQIFVVNQPKNLIKLDLKILFKKNFKLFNQANLLKDIPQKIYNIEAKKVSLCPCKPGEEGANEQLKLFCSLSELENEININNNSGIYKYNRNRDLPIIQGTSFISAALSTGTLSPRVAWEAMNNAKSIALHRRNELEVISVNTWEKELIWREFYQHCLFLFPELEKGPFRKKWKNFPWDNNTNNFNSWMDGLTGYPIVDAAMRQLNTTGWMHNRCRMIVASFLVKDLICDWRIGEKYFMEKLVDGDIAANNGGWQWSASSGMDTKPLRIFNPLIQARKFDSEARYIKKWLPELSHVNPKDLINCEILPIERRGYPAPIVNHKEQQSLFKDLYSNLT